MINFATLFNSYNIIDRWRNLDAIKLIVSYSLLLLFVHAIYLANNSTWLEITSLFLVPLLPPGNCNSRQQHKQSNVRRISLLLCPGSPRNADKQKFIKSTSLTATLSFSPRHSGIYLFNKRWYWPYVRLADDRYAIHPANKINTLIIFLKNYVVLEWHTPKRDNRTRLQWKLLENILSSMSLYFPCILTDLELSPCNYAGNEILCRF